MEKVMAAVPVDGKAELVGAELAGEAFCDHHCAGVALLGIRDKARAVEAAVLADVLAEPWRGWPPGVAPQQEGERIRVKQGYLDACRQSGCTWQGWDGHALSVTESLVGLHLQSFCFLIHSR
ncbi:MAG: hypothetical protein Q4C67_08500, partial [Deinococcus sp.]|nr:hypothetical protein [Deinococcus sp.]